MNQPHELRAFRASPANRWLLAVALVVVAGVLVWHFSRSPSEAAKLGQAVSNVHADAICGKVGVMAFAGGRSNLYGCTWNPSSWDPLASSRHCEVWANGSAYDVTKTARLVFRAQGEPSPC